MIKSAGSLVRNAFFALVLCYTMLLLSPYETAAGKPDTDSGKAIVKDGSVLVHSGPSARSKVLRSLSKGAAVTIGIEMKTSGSDWCGITENGMSSISGYVLCDTLDRQMTAPVQWKSIDGINAAKFSKASASRGLSAPRPNSDVTALLYMTTW